MRGSFHVGLLVSMGITTLAFAFGCSKKTPEQQEAEARTTFQTVCARCHGPEGRGGVAGGPGQAPPRNFADHSFHQSRSDADLKAVISKGKSPGMPAFGGAFDDGQMTALVKIVRSFDPPSGATTPAAAAANVGAPGK